MAITNFTRIDDVRWMPELNQYTPITPLVAKSGTDKTTLTITWYHSSNTATPNAFTIAITTTENESHSLSTDGTVKTKLNLDCAGTNFIPATTYFTLTEDQGWNQHFSVTIYITNRDATNTTWVFTKGKGGGHRN